MCELRERVWGVMYDGTYDVYVVRRENVTGSLQGWDKRNMEQCIKPLLLDRKDLKVEC